LMPPRGESTSVIESRNRFLSSQEIQPHQMNTPSRPRLRSSLNCSTRRRLPWRGSLSQEEYHLEGHRIRQPTVPRWLGDTLFTCLPERIPWHLRSMTRARKESFGIAP